MTVVSEPPPAETPTSADYQALAELLPQLAWIAKADGSIFWFNRRWYEYTGTEPQAMLGWGWQSVHHPNHLPAVLDRWRSSLAKGEPLEMVFPLKGADGVFRPFLTRVQPIRDANGQIIRWLGTNTDITEQQQITDALAAEKRRLETLNRTTELVGRELELEKLVQTVTDAGVELTGAQFGAFFYNVRNAKGESYTLYTISGAPRAAFEKFPMPRNTKVFDPTFQGTGIVRSDDITTDPRYGNNPPYQGMPPGHLPVRSYLAVPVVSRSGEVLGGLFFGHSTPGVFTERHEQLLVGIAAQAAIGIDNARLYENAQRELRERRAAEKQRQLLMNELNHRVKNTLATVQSVVAQTLRKEPISASGRAALDERLMALADAHDLLTRETWEGTTLRQVVELALRPYPDRQERFDVQGPEVALAPKTALAFAMALHELLTNAIKHGGLSALSGRVSLTWTTTGEGKSAQLQVTWRETGGPAPKPSPERGFGLRMVQWGLGADLRGVVRIDFAPTGLVCVIDAPLPGHSTMEPSP